MSLPQLDRRTLIRGGATIGCCLTSIGMGTRHEASSVLALGVPLTGALIGWLNVRPDGSGLIDIVQTDGQWRAVRPVATETIAPMGSIERMARRASAVLSETVARSWQLPVVDCTIAWSRIEHRPSGRSIPFRIWTDFV